MAHYTFQSILSQQWRSQGSGGGVLSPEKGEVLLNQVIFSIILRLFRDFFAPSLAGG